MSLLKKDSLLTHILLMVGASVLLVTLLIYPPRGYGKGTRPTW